MDKKRGRRKNQKAYKPLLATVLVILLAIGSLNIPWTINVYAKENTEIEEAPIVKGSTEVTDELEIQSNEQTEPIDGASSLTQITESDSSNNNSEKVITAWNWSNEDELEIQQDEETGTWGLGLPGMNFENQADFDTMVSMLPSSIEATIQDTKQTEELAIIWSCENYVQDESGNWPVNGTYIFNGILPDGYDFADNTKTVEITIDIGGGATTYENTGGFTVTGGTYGVDYTYVSYGTIGALVVQTSKSLTITTNGVAVNAVIRLWADNAHITLNNVVLNSDSNTIGEGGKSGWGSIVCSNSNPNITLEGTNIIADTTEWAGEITCTNSAKSLLIDGNGSLTCDKILFYLENNSDGTLNVDGPTLSYLTVDGISSHSFKNCTVNERTYDANGNLIGDKNAGFFIVSGGESGIDWTYDSATSMLLFKNSGTYYVTGDGVEHREQINIGDNIQVTLYLENVKCNSSYAGMGIQPTSNVTLILEGDNSFISGNNYNAGIEFNSAATGSLIIDGKGSLSGKGGLWGAGIGGGSASSGNNITIKGGIVTATGGEQGAGIGGGSLAAGNNITIKGGIVTATGGESGAGIGGGYKGAGTNITIDGGTIIAKREGTEPYGAGIGGGNEGAGTNITINDGIINVESYATKYSSGAGIGGGYNGDGTDIIINGGEITTGSTDNEDYGAGIGGGYAGDGINITINGGRVNINKGYGAGIGSGCFGSIGTNIKINGGTISTGNAIEDGGTGIGGGTAGDINITNGSVKADSIGKTPTDGKGNNVYLAILPKLSGVNSVDVDGKSYTRAGAHPDNDDNFYLYLSGTEHTITCDCARFVAKRDASATTFTVTGYALGPVFTISNTDSTATISVSNYKDGYSGNTQYACIKKSESLKDSDWGTANTFTGLESATEYTCYVKFGGNDSYKESNTVSQTFYTNAAEPLHSALKIDYANETVTFDDSIYEVNTQIEFDGTSLKSGDSISNFISNWGESVNALYIRVKAVENGPGASIELPITISRPAAPNSVSKIGSTASSISFTSYSGWEYKMESGSWQSSNTFTGLSASKSYNFAVRTKATTWSFASTEQIISNVSTEQASYTVSIPKTTAKVPDKGTSNIGNISVTEDTTHKFDLGNNGKVKVSVSSGTDADGKITLIRDQDTNTKITSLLSTNGSPCTLNKVLATYTTTNKTQTVPLSLTAPEYSGTTIPAGTYNGTVVFGITYSEN